MGDHDSRRQANAIFATMLMFRRYEKMLEDADFTGPDKTEASHLRWMCEEALSKLSEHVDSVAYWGSGEYFPIDKYSRWLGFVQGVMLMHGIVTVDDERDFSRPLFTKVT
jgi:hypothetical protein